MSKSCKVHVNQLQVGNFVRLPVAWKDHPFLFNSFRVKQEAQIQLIRSLGIEHVFVDLDRSDVMPLQEQPVSMSAPAKDLAPLIDELEKKKQEQIEQLKKMRRELGKTEQEFDRSLAKMRNLMNKLRSRPLNAIQEAEELIQDITRQLLANDNLVLHLMGDAKKDDSFYFHSLNVAVLCMLLAKELGWDRADIEAIGLGALFHDVGKLKVPAQILKKQADLTTPEINFIKQHPNFGVEFVKLTDTFPESALPVITNHHEFLDGSGYPKGLKGKDLCPLSQLVAVVNEYDTLCHPDNLSKAKTPYAALGYLFKNYKGKLNAEFVGQLIRMLGIYPPGSVVELTSGQFGMVMAVNISKLLFPRIMVYDALVPKDQAPIIDLEAEGLSIVRCLPPAALPEKIFNYLNPRERVTYFFGQESKR
ncbi:HD-GYP domain-containing protein [Shewanella litorisediminis]|uniref:HD-GYP domain-containing protein n=1 Tax=Shewanella litorisediminis TaxID=1173586 RepID=A0ABX7G7P1_9GAMM|nr:HD-GYP domain-containing protein [Shewanella litorisediminis]MCL2920134.1 HD-GYP domain-containing protein [Shewanella litorisediminis]QRH03248.1 HD-GYP domain-containing protein [Shewanella litorisediminis]